MTGAVLFYVQHLLGIGHLRRALRLVEGADEGGRPGDSGLGRRKLPELAGVAAERVVQLAPIRTRDAGFKDLVDGDGRPIDDALRAARRETLLDAFDAAQPDAVIIEAFPFGRRAFRFELEPLIAAARARRPPALVLCSLRDIVVAPDDAQRRRAIVARVRDDFDAVLVHGDPSLIPLEASFPEAREIADRLIYTGYVGGSAGSAAADDGAGADEVLVSAGGGAVGGALMATALATRRLGCLADLGWRLLAGPNLPPAQFAALSANCPTASSSSATGPISRRCCGAAGCRSARPVTTLCSTSSPRGAAAVLVPFADLHETEQTLRAERLAARGVVEMVAPSSTITGAARRSDRAGGGGRPAPLAIDTTGARRSAQLIAGMIGT